MSEYPIENVKFSITFRYNIPHEENKARFDAINEYSNLSLVVHSDKQKINFDGSIVLLMTFSDAFYMDVRDLDMIDIEDAIIEYTNGKILGANIDNRDDTLEFEIVVNDWNCEEDPSPENIFQ